MNIFRKSFALALTVYSCLSALFADSNPLWTYPTPIAPISIEQVGPDPVSSQEPLSSPEVQSMMMGLTVPEAVDEEIAAIADGFGNDPVAIFNYVRNEIRFEPYYGLKKGAKLTLLEGSGNDFDQCALLAEILKASGIASNDIKFIRGRHRMPLSGNNGANVYQHLGLELPFPNATDYEDAYGVPNPYPTFTDGEAMFHHHPKVAVTTFGIPGAASWLTFDDTITYFRTWLKVTIGGVDYELDPSFKWEETIEGIELLGATSYDRATLLTASGLVNNSDYTQDQSGTGASQSAVDAYLEGINSDILDLLRSEPYANLSYSEIVGGRRIVPQSIDDLADAFPLNQFYPGDRFNESDITATLDNYKVKVRFKITGEMDYQMPTADLEGQKITLTFSGNKVYLKLDDAADVDALADATVTASEFDLEMSVTHPGGLVSSSPETKRYQKNDNFAYAIIYGFSPSGRLLQKRNEQLSAYLAEGKDDDSLEVRTELLNIMGLNWLIQSNASFQFQLNRQGVLPFMHHTFGRVAQEQGFYIDVGLVKSGIFPRDGEYDEGYELAVQLGALFTSAMEHAVIEQMQPQASAVSTVNILRIALKDEVKVYLANSSNWSTVKTQIQSGGYPVATRNEFNAYYTSGSGTYAPETLLFLPRSYSIRPKLADGSNSDWEGSGWIIRGPGRAGMKISGDYDGGYSFWSPGVTNNYISSPSIVGSSLFNPSYNYTPSYSGIKSYVPPSYSTPNFYGSDPVDMASGAFIFANTDLTTGAQSAPRGLSFSRTYRSLANERDNQALGFGWSHNLYIRASQRTSIEAGLGQGTSRQAAAFLTASLITADLYRRDASPREWGVTALATGWFTDQMTNNAVSINIGHDAFQFIRQPDGSYESPTGSTMTLTKVGDDYRLQQRLGNTIYFEDTEDTDDDSQRVQKIVDVDGKEMTFHYHNDDRLDYVEDAYGRRYTFAYTDTNFPDYITSITDNSQTGTSTSRMVHFRYDSEGNLDRYTDPESKYSYYIYQADSDPDGGTPTDPGGTAADEHRMVRMRNHDKEIITQNVYDSLGRVEKQYLHGDTGKTWTLRYTGVANTEENPEGDITTYFYDERGRASGKRDASGYETRWEYDGQDHIVKSTNVISLHPEVTEETIYHYDEDHNLLQVDHPRGGGSTINTYDDLHRPWTVTDPDNNTTTYHYFDTGFHAGKNRPEEVEDPEGTTTFTYYTSSTEAGNPGGAAAGQVKTVTDDDTLVTTHAYDAYGQPDWSDAPGSVGEFRTDFLYTSRGDLDYVVDAMEVKTDFTYNARRQVTKTEFDKGGVDEAVENRAYDNQGRLEYVTLPTDNASQRVRMRTTYTSTDQVDSEYLRNATATEADDRVAYYHYDGRDWNDYSLDADSRRTDFIYFANGEVERMERPEERDSSFAFDGAGRPLSATNPGAPTNRTIGFVFDETTASDQLGAGFPRTVFTDSDSLSTTSEYDRRGNLRFYTNKRNKTFEMRYDGLGRSTEVITPIDAANTRSTVTTYKHRGAIATLAEPSGQTTTFNYNSTTGRLESTVDPVGTISFTDYDDNGNLKETTEGSDTINRTYDRLNRVKSYEDVNGQEIGYRYYDSGRLHKVIYPGGTEGGVGHVEYTYWPTGRLHQVIDKLDSTSTPRTTTYTWRNDGRLESIERPNGTERNIQYDDAGRPWMIQELTSAGDLISIQQIGYHPSDEIAWLYQLPQLEMVTGPPTPSPVDAMTYNDDNQLATFKGKAVTHDPDGNMTRGPLPDGTIGDYVFNARNQLTSAGGLSYTYDAEGQRIAINGNGDSITQVVDSNRGFSRPLVITKNGVTKRYIYGVGLAYEVDVATGDAVYYHYDQSGNTIALSDDAEQVIEEIRYAPFGTITYRENVGGTFHDTPFLFGGFFALQTDSNGLVQMRARYYNPLIRRFINVDPAMAGWNWYAYAGGNPMSFVDPSGLGNDSVLDALQTGLGFLGMVPIIGNIADIANVGISLARGNYGDAALNAAAALPGIGLAVGGAVASYRSFNAVRGISRAAKIVDVGSPGAFTLREFGEAVSGNPFATRAYSSLQETGFNINIVNRADGFSGETLSNGIVNINRMYNRSAQEALSTLVHESKHVELLRNTGNLYGTRGVRKGEYLARAREFYFQNGRRPNASEIDKIRQLIIDQGY